MSEPENDDLEGAHLPGTTQLWPDERRGPWALELHWQVIDGRAECVGVDLRSSRPVPEGQRPAPNDPPRKRGAPLSASLWRQIKLGQIIEEHRAEVWHRTRGLPLYDQRGRRRPRNTPKRLHEVAEVYTIAWREKRPTGQAVADTFGTSVANARKLIHQARLAGLLPETSSGVASAAVRRRRTAQPRNKGD